MAVAGGADLDTVEVVGERSHQALRGAGVLRTRGVLQLAADFADDVESEARALALDPVSDRPQHLIVETLDRAHERGYVFAFARQKTRDQFSQLRIGFYDIFHT